MSRTQFNLPVDAIEFLRDGGQLVYDPRDCEPGEVKLKKLDELALGEIWIGTNGAGDPNSGKDGHYAISAVSLTGKCEAYDPEYILLWLPEEEMFGTWDCDYWVLSVFPAAKWSDIVASPARFLNAQWDPGSHVGVRFQPWLNYALKPGRPF